MQRIIIFASGSGSNAENIIKYFQDKTTATIALVLSNNLHAKVFDRCKRLHVPARHFTRKEFYESDAILNELKAHADYIILAGFLWKMPSTIVTAFENRMINIHPALLPKYGGKGMYGMHVHNAVAANKETETGITIHYVNEHYDEGAIIFQARTSLTEQDTPETIAEKIHVLEQAHFPRVIEEVIVKNA